MKMEHCARCGHTWGHHAGFARCPKCGWNATQSSSRHPTVSPPRGTMAFGSRSHAIIQDDENVFGGIGPIEGSPHELDFGDE